jgi:hypothetical protein
MVLVHLLPTAGGAGGLVVSREAMAEEPPLAGERSASGGQGLPEER